MKHESYILKTTGEKVPVEPKNGSDFQLQELKDAIGGGYIEVVRLSHNRLMVIDEEGKLKELPPNPRATAVYGVLSDFIAGDALVCHKSQIQ